MCCIDNEVFLHQAAAEVEVKTLKLVLKTKFTDSEFPFNIKGYKKI